MSELTKKILESGLVDETTAELMERWGTLPAGSAELAHGKAAELARVTANEDAKKGIKKSLAKMVDSIGVEVDNYRRLKETMFDLNQLRWPTKVRVWRDASIIHQDVEWLDAVIDRMGRYYFRPADVHMQWFVPGFRLIRQGFIVHEEILEVSELYVGDQVAAIQITTKMC